MKNHKWNPVRGYEGYYEASIDGQIRSIDRIVGTKSYTGKVLKQAMVGKYMVVTLCKGGFYKSRTVHSIVLEAFRGSRPDGKQCRHLDGNPLNNKIENLAWGSAKENAEDKERHGTASRTRGSFNHLAKLTEADVIQIRDMLAMGVPQKEISAEFNLTQACISRIKHRKTWKHI